MKCSKCRYGVQHNYIEGMFYCHNMNCPKYNWRSEVGDFDCEYGMPLDPNEDPTNVFVKDETQVQPQLQLYCVRYLVEDNMHHMRMEYLVNACSPKEAEAIAREYFTKTDYADERLVEAAEIQLIAEKGVINSSKMYLG